MLQIARKRMHIIANRQVVLLAVLTVTDRECKYPDLLLPHAPVHPADDVIIECDISRMPCNRNIVIWS
jgi:hypothetical protein